MVVIYVDCHLCVAYCIPIPNSVRTRPFTSLLACAIRKHMQTPLTNSHPILSLKYPTRLQQQIHAQQIPGAPQQPVPSLGQLNLPLSFGGPMGGLPHGHPGMLKMAQEQQQQLHGRGDEMKMVGGGPSVEDRLVLITFRSHLICF